MYIEFLCKYLIDDLCYIIFDKLHKNFIYESFGKITPHMFLNETINIDKEYYERYKKLSIVEASYHIQDCKYCDIFDEKTIYNITNNYFLLSVKSLFDIKKFENQKYASFPVYGPIQNLYFGILYSDNHKYLSENDLNKFCASYNINLKLTRIRKIESIVRIQNKIYYNMYKKNINKFYNLHLIQYIQPNGTIEVTDDISENDILEQEWIQKCFSSM